MRPRPRGRGIDADGFGKLILKWLQCGHGRAAVESTTLITALNSFTQASMWPRPRGRGISDFEPDEEDGEDASMWPRPRGRGITVSQMRERREVECFIVATAARPWNPEMHKLAISIVIGFNVATAARPWNRFDRDEDGCSDFASMWPRPRGRGILADRKRLKSAGLASMWPRPRGRGIEIHELRTAV